MRIIREKTAAVCVDYQERILPVMTDPETLLQNTVKLLKGLRVLGVPVYLTQQYTKGLGDTVAPIREAAGTSEHLEKLTFSAYPQLREKLLPPEQQPYVLLCGIESHICVLQTAMDLKAHGYQPYLVADCLSSRKPADHRWRWSGPNRRVSSSPPARPPSSQLLAAAGTPDSKAIQKLIK